MERFLNQEEVTLGKHKMEEIINEVKKEAKEYFKEACPSHDWNHIERVYNLALKIAKKENADLFIVKLAALLHDIGIKQEDEFNKTEYHSAISIKIAQMILHKYKISHEIMDKVLSCISTHKFRNDKVKKTIEAKVLFDADKLDCIGAIGVARAYTWAGERKIKLYSEKTFFETNYEKKHSPIIEFSFKLTKIKDEMQTKTGKKIATSRHKYTIKYFKELKREITNKI